MSRFDITVLETARFIEDCALHGLEDGDRSDLCERLSAHPGAGKPRADKQSFLEWEFRDCLVTYVLSADLSRLVLLELRPNTRPPTLVLQQAWKWIERMSVIRQLLGL